jgi:F-type H+-transporting ATPase subunit b
MKASMLDETRKQQQDLLERARRDIDAEKAAALAELRREAVELTIAAASKVIEKNLDDQQNRRLVEQYLATLQ